MGSISNYSENELLDHALGTAYAPASTVYLGLSTADPLDDASGLSEPAGNGYARTAITFAAAAARRVTQTGAVTFPQATGSWGDITHWAIFDASSGGNVLAHGALNEPKTIVAGNTPTVADGVAYVEWTAGEMSTYLAHKLLELMFRNVAYAAPATYVGLTTAVVGDGDDGSTITEVAGGSYARQQVNPAGGASPAWTAAAAGAAENAQAISFPTATASWGTVTSTFIADAVTAGNILFYDNAVADQPVGTDDDVQFAAGAFDVALS